jgi:hypothetical protein
VPEIGRGQDGSVAIKSLCINAQSLRYLDLLVDCPRLISFEGLQIRVPEPAVFALHKLIVSSRRMKKEKQKSDLETGVGLLEFLYSRPDEIKRIKSILLTIPKKWSKTILSVSAKYFPRLNQTTQEY